MTHEEMHEAELARQGAEVLREEHEVRRRIGEGGPDQHVPGNVAPGRVEAEEQRMIAEERRNDLRAFYVRMATVVALPLAFIALIPSLVGLYLLDREVKDRTRDNRKLIALVETQRKETIVSQCRDQNKRHRELEAFVLDQGQTQEANAATFVFIDKLAPLQDCKALGESNATD